MTTSQIIALALGWTAATIAICALLAVRRTAAELDARRRTFTAPDGSEITPLRQMSDEEYEAFKARWYRTYGRSGTVDGTVCEAYQVPATAADSGLCAGCGMSDYKHEEEPGA